MLELIFLTSLIFGGITLLIVFYWRRVIDGSITSHFRAAEAISEGKLPKDWAPRIERRLRIRSLLPGAGLSGTELAVRRLDRLERHVRRSAFFADEQTQDVLLNQFELTRRRWESMSWEEVRHSAAT